MNYVIWEENPSLISGQEYIGNQLIAQDASKNGFRAIIDEYVAWTGTTTNAAVGSSDLNFLDSPATTSATTYKTQFKK